MTTTIRPIRAGEETRLAAVLADALADDRFIRWIAGEDHARAVTWMRAGIKLARRHGLVLAYEPRGSPGASRARVSLALMTATWVRARPVSVAFSVSQLVLDEDACELWVE